MGEAESQIAESDAASDPLWSGEKQTSTPTASSGEENVMGQAAMCLTAWSNVNTCSARSLLVTTAAAAAARIAE